MFVLVIVLVNEGIEIFVLVFVIEYITAARAGPVANASTNESTVRGDGVGNVVVVRMEPQRVDFFQASFFIVIGFIFGFLLGKFC